MSEVSTLEDEIRNTIKSSGQDDDGPHVRLFGLKTAADVLNKLRWEIDGLENAQKFDNQSEALYFASNAAITAWHFYEWHGINKREDKVSKFADLVLMHDIATQVKHFEISSPLYKTGAIEVDAIGVLNLTDKEKKLIADQNPDKPNVFYPQNRFQTLITVNDRSALDILNGIYQFFEKTIYGAPLSR